MREGATTFHTRPARASINVRPAESTDGERIKTLARESFRSSYSLSPQQIETIVDNEFDAGTLDRRFDDPDATVFVAEDPTTAPAGRKSTRTLDSEPVRWNAATLVVHLLGHVLGAGHGDGDVMAPFSYDPSRRSIPAFDVDVRDHLHRIAERVPEESSPRGRTRTLAFHMRSLLHNPGTVASTLLDSRAPLIPFSLPRLSTAAVTPTLILVFSAEAWDVGLNLADHVAVLFAAGSIVAAAVHLLYVQRLFFPESAPRSSPSTWPW